MFPYDYPSTVPLSLHPYPNNETNKTTLPLDYSLGGELTASFLSPNSNESKPLEQRSVEPKPSELLPTAKELVNTFVIFSGSPIRTENIYKSFLKLLKLVRSTIKGEGENSYDKTRLLNNKFLKNECTTLADNLKKIGFFTTPLNLAFLFAQAFDKNTLKEEKEQKLSTSASCIENIIQADPSEKLDIDKPHTETNPLEVDMFMDFKVLARNYYTLILFTEKTTKGRDRFDRGLNNGIFIYLILAAKLNECGIKENLKNLYDSSVLNKILIFTIAKKIHNTLKKINISVSKHSILLHFIRSYQNTLQKKSIEINKCLEDKENIFKEMYNELDSGIDKNTIKERFVKLLSYSQYNCYSEETYKKCLKNMIQACTVTSESKDINEQIEKNEIKESNDDSFSAQRLVKAILPLTYSHSSEDNNVNTLEIEKNILSHLKNNVEVVNLLRKLDNEYNLEGFKKNLFFKQCTQISSMLAANSIYIDPLVIALSLFESYKFTADPKDYITGLLRDEVSKGITFSAQNLEKMSLPENASSLPLKVVINFYYALLYAFAKKEEAKDFLHKVENQLQAFFDLLQIFSKNYNNSNEEALNDFLSLDRKYFANLHLVKAIKNIALTLKEQNVFISPILIFHQLIVGYEKKIKDLIKTEDNSSQTINYVNALRKEFKTIEEHDSLVKTVIKNRHKQNNYEQIKTICLEADALLTKTKGFFLTSLNLKTYKLYLENVLEFILLIKAMLFKEESYLKENLLL